MARISSDIGAAEDATSYVKNVNISRKTIVYFTQSNISGMKAGENVANQMMDDLDQLINCVKTQAGKFTQLAFIKQEMDVADQSIFKK